MLFITIMNIIFNKTLRVKFYLEIYSKIINGHTENTQ